MNLQLSALNNSCYWPFDFFLPCKEQQTLLVLYVHLVKQATKELYHANHAKLAKKLPTQVHQIVQLVTKINENIRMSKLPQNAKLVNLEKFLMKKNALLSQSMQIFLFQTQYLFVVSVPLNLLQQMSHGLSSTRKKKQTLVTHFKSV